VKRRLFGSLPKLKVHLPACPKTRSTVSDDKYNVLSREMLPILSDTAIYFRAEFSTVAFHIRNADNSGVANAPVELDS
jgi:hypothetical protein